MIRSARGQTAVLGFVLLVGIVAVGAVGVLVVASDVTANLEQETENERVEAAFVELSKQMSTAASRSDATHSMNLDVGDRGAVIKNDTGEIRIQGGDVDTTIGIGAIEYEGDDGTRLAYQAGAVFRETGNETQVVSAPPIHYDVATETFSFPIVEVSDEADLGSGDISLSHVETNPHREASIVENDTVTITVTSEYYRGWEAYFERQVGAASIQEIDHDNRTVTVDLGYLDLETAFDDGMIISDEYGASGQPDIDESDYREGYMPPMDEVIEDMVEDMEAGKHDGTYDTVDGTEDPDNGTYYVTEGIDLTEEDLEIDVSEGNVTFVVDGNVSINDHDLDVSTGGTDNEFRIYTTGNLDVSGQDACVDGCPESDPDPEDINASQLQVYGTSETLISLGTGDTTFEGSIYAASNEEFEENEIHPRSCSAQACLHSSVGFYGSLIASSVEATGGEGSIDFKHDPDLVEMDELYPDGYSLPPQLTYLNLAKHEIDVRN